MANLHTLDYAQPQFGLNLSLVGENEIAKPTYSLGFNTLDANKLDQNSLDVQSLDINRNSGSGNELAPDDAVDFIQIMNDQNKALLEKQRWSESQDDIEIQEEAEHRQLQSTEAPE